MEYVEIIHKVRGRIEELADELRSLENVLAILDGPAPKPTRRRRSGTAVQDHPETEPGEAPLPESNGPAQADPRDGI